jgi:hypothetical protein
MHCLNILNTFYAVKSVIFHHLPILTCQDSCFTLLSLQALGLVDHEDLLHEFAQAKALRGSTDSGDSGDSLLIHAAKSNWPRVIEALLASPSWSQLCDAELHKCVFLCAEKGFFECLASLISARPGVMISRRDGTSALHIAAQNGHHNCCEWLVDVGNIAINVRNNIQQTPLMYAVGSPETVSWFLSRADVNAELVDAEGMSAFQHASQERSAVAVCVMDLLLRREAVGAVV